MIRPTLLRWSLLAALGCLPGATFANSMITFETRPNGSAPADDAVLHNPYTIDGGGTVRFFFDVADQNGVYNNTYDDGWDVKPVFEQWGTDGTDGFVATLAGGFDMAPMGSGLNPVLGDFFLRQPDAIGSVPGPFIIAYDTTQTIREFSGEIWDIDSTREGKNEQWRVDVLDASGVVLRTRLSPDGRGAPGGGNSLDSLPWHFGFNNLPDGVAAIRLTFVGTKTDGIGLAFNNFSPTFAVPGSVVPEPSSLALLGTAAGAGLLTAARRRRRLPVPLRP